jgi:O-methyltransferase
MRMAHQDIFGCCVGGDVVNLVRRAARRVHRAAFGNGSEDILSLLTRRDRRFSTFVDGLEYINYEAVAGDIVEFGVFTGVSLALLAKAVTFDAKGMHRRVVGFDSFEGLPGSSEPHARWQPGDCATNHAWHPLLAVGDAVTPDVTRQLFRACGLGEPILHVGPFAATLPAAFPAQHSRVALAHFDCDLYESTRAALEAIAPALQDGSLLLFDDWFHYRGNPTKGEARAFGEFLEAHPEWGAVQYRSYGTFCNSFILHRR